MILAAVDPGGDIALQKRFRGKNLRFWYGRRFPELSWLEPGSGSAEISLKGDSTMREILLSIVMLGKED